MENQIEIFNNAEFGQVRVVVINEEPWFVLADVCKVLELTTPAKVSARLEEDEKGVTSIHTLGGQQKMTIINESGLYSVILRSDKPQAKPFRKWVTSEVLPTIRKHGAYMVDSVLEQALASPDFLIQLATQLKAEKEKNKELSDTVHEQSAKIEEMKPKYTYCEVVLACPNAISVSVIAKDYGMSARQLNSILADKKIQYKQGKIWLLYQKYAEYDYTITQTSTRLDSTGNPFAVVHTYWTQKGRMFIYELLKADGILPLVERQTA